MPTELVIVELRADTAKLVAGFKKAGNEAKGFAGTVKKGTSSANAAISKTNTNLKKTGTGVKNAKVQFSSLGRSITSAFLPMIAGVAIIGKLTRALGEATDIVKDFEKASAELSAITGATGDDLKFLQDKAIELGPAFGKGATEIVNAFKLVGSARPELLKNSEALAEVTKNALILSQASGDDLETSVGALTATLNQFGISANKSGDAINTLAAGSKFGAAPVNDISDSLIKFGAVASAANVSVEESVALIEVLADKSIVGAESGTKLRSVLSKIANAEGLPQAALDQLEKFGVDIDLVTNNQIPLNERLTEFSKIADDGVALMKVFGEENQVAGSIILNNVDRFEQLTEAVTGTDTAIKQAAINTKTLAFEQQKTEAVYESLILSLDEGNGSISNAVSAWEKVKQAIFGATLAYNDGTEGSIENISATNDAIQALDKLGIRLGSVAEEAQGLTDEIRVMNIAVDQLVGKNVDARISYFGLGTAVSEQAKLVRDLQEQFAKATGANRELIGSNLRQQGQILTALEKEVKERRAGLETSVITRKKFGEEEVEVVEELTEKEIAARKKAGEKLKQDREQLEKDLIDLRIRTLQDSRERELAELDKTFAEDKIKFGENAEAKILLDAEFKEKQRAINQEFDLLGVEDSQKLAEFAANEEIANAEQLAVRLNEIKLAGLQQEKVVLENNLQDTDDVNARILQQENELNASKLVLSTKTADDQATISNTSAQSEQETAQGLADAEVDIEIQKLETIIALRKAAGEDTLDLELQLAQKKRDIADEEAQREAERRQETLQQSQEGAQALTGFIIALNERELQIEQEQLNQALATEQEALQDKLNKELISQEQFDISSAQLEAKFAKDSAKIKEKQAQTDKNAAIFKATIDGLAAVVGAGSITPQAIAIAVANAINIAALIAKPIPAFAKGTDNAPGGWALVGEEGPELVNLPKGSAVKTADQTAGFLSGVYDVKNNEDYINNIKGAILSSYNMDNSRSQMEKDITVKVKGQYDLMMANNAEKSRALLKKMSGQLDELNKNVNTHKNIFQ